MSANVLLRSEVREMRKEEKEWTNTVVGEHWLDRRDLDFWR